MAIKLELEPKVDGELAGKDVAHIGACTAQRSVKGLVVVADAVVAQHDINGLFGSQGEITAEARLKVEAIGHLDLVGTETEIGTQIHGEKRRDLGCGEVGLQATKDFDVVANIIAGAMIGVTSSAMVLVAGVVEPIKVLVARACTDEEVVVDAVAADEVHTEGELLVLVQADAASSFNGFLEARGLSEGNDGCSQKGDDKEKLTHIAKKDMVKHQWIKHDYRFSLRTSGMNEMVQRM